MADNFDMKKFLTENKLGPYAKAKGEMPLGRAAGVTDEHQAILKAIQDMVMTGDHKILDLIKDKIEAEWGDEPESSAFAETKNPMKTGTTKEDIGGDIGDAEAEKMMDFLAEKEKFLTKGDNQVIVRIGDSIETLEGIFDQMISMPTKNIRGLAEYGHQTIQDIKQILK